MKRVIKAAVATALLLTAVPAVHASITITPAMPTTADGVMVHVEQVVNGSPHITSTTISRSGNTFTVQQHVDIACLLPATMPVGANFNIGTLAPGTYTVNATMSFTSVDPIPCHPPPISESTTFVVSAPVPVPALHPAALAALTALIAAIALAKLRGQ
ncbi:MAG TPA: hypothetical protein VFN10_18105 [Thermoanaerobaculia bacterium]|nr:hypothetical protein [Thermoanaerobaculia bacterium]